MLAGAVILLVLAAVGGLILVILHARAAAPWWLGATHGLVGLAGVVVLTLALAGPPRGVTGGTTHFGAFAACLLGAAVLTGLGPLVARFKRRPMPSLVLGLHATFAIMGLVVLASYL